jgi:hypothetical protein
MKDPFSHLFAAIHFCLIIAQSYKDFFPSIVATLGFSGTTTFLIQAPPPIIAFLVTLVISWSSGKRLEHGYHIIVPILFTLIGTCIMITQDNVGARYFSMILLVIGPFVGLNVSLPMFPYHKKLLLTMTQASNFLGNYCCTSTSYQACRSNRLCQLCFFCISLVHTLLLPTKPGAILPDCRRRDYRGLWSRRYFRLDYEMVCSQEEQGIGSCRECFWRA